jgi:gluconate 2-dehydrogenase gamma chain
MIDRRELIQRAAMALGGAISSSAVLGVLSGCAASPEPAHETHTAKFFTPGEAKTVAAISEHIIPRTDTPGAIDVGVPAFIDRMMADYYQDRERNAVRAGLIRIDQDAQTAQGKTFVALTSDQQVELLKRYDREAYEQAHGGGTVGADRHVFGTLKELTTLGYFTSQPGATKSLKYAAVPGPYRGDIPVSEVGKAWAI